MAVRGGEVGGGFPAREPRRLHPRLRVCAGFQQPAHHLRAALGGSALQGRHAVAVRRLARPRRQRPRAPPVRRRVQRRALARSRARSARRRPHTPGPSVPAVARLVQRRAPVAPPRVGVAPSRSSASTHCRSVARCSTDAPSTPRAGVGSGAQKSHRAHPRDRAARRCAGRDPDVVARVWAGRRAVREQQLHHLEVPLVCRVV